MAETVSQWTPSPTRVLMHFGPHGGGDRRVAHEAYTHPDAPGLAVTRDLPGYGWTVTHVASGYCVSRTLDWPRIAYRETAERFALALAPLTDWTRGADAVMGDKLTLAPLVNRARETVFGVGAGEPADE